MQVIWYRAQVWKGLEGTGGSGCLGDYSRKLFFR